MVKIIPSISVALVWLIVATILHIIPGSSIPKETWLTKIRIDKWVHIAMFLVMVIVWFLALRKISTSVPPRRILISVVLACLAYGVMMEFVQKLFVSNRSFDLWDILADAAGSAAGYILCLVRYIKK